MKTNMNHLPSGIQLENLKTIFSNRATRLFSLFTLLFVLVATNSITAQSTDKIVKGIVTHSDDGEQLAGVHIQLKSTAIGTVTDASGKFTFPQKLKAQDVLVFSFVGLKTLEYTIVESTPEFLDIQLSYEDFTMVGELGDSGLYTAKQRPLARLWTSVKRIF
jgi:hypothetical protein